MKSIQLKDINFSYHQNQEKTLKDINLTINQGEVILLCGASGCGKSTLLQIINGIIPDQKEGDLHGKIFINEKDYTQIKTIERSKIIGSVFQNPKSQFFHLNTLDELYFGGANHLVPLNEMQQRLKKIAKEFKIESLINRNIFKLSGGQKQQIAIASVKMNEPLIYVLDEPSSSLDQKSIENLKNILITLKSQGATIIVGEHRLYYMLEICDKVIYMKDGTIQKEYLTKDFLQIQKKQREEMGLRSFEYRSIQDIVIQENKSKEFILIENLIVKYGQNTVVNIESLNIPKHQIVAITGENGVGKTSFVRAFTGLLKTKKAKINQQPLKVKQQQRDSFMVMQDVNSQLYCESVIDELIHLSEENDEDIMNARKILKKLNLLDYEQSHPMVLSGGQKQRLAIATAMFLNKKYLIFDEPTSGLDYDNMLRVSEILHELATKVDVVLVITHDFEFIEHCAHKVIDFEKT